ncbi:MAG: RICIN domain-containing protein [Sedimentisphaerales bacterium]|nr:RICIN domain-containing protein [Sedimentisphaerales bacterium]
MKKPGESTNQIRLCTIIILSLIFTFFIYYANLQAEPITIQNGHKILENFGTHLHAHGGGVIKVGDYYYWFGENRHYNSNNNFYAVSCYRSKDLKEWELRNHVLTQAADSDLEFAKIERPKVIYNSSTGKYVMWMHKEYGNSYSEARAAVASCDTVDGDYTYHGSFNPLGYMSRDCTLFVDDDGSAYFVSAANNNADLHIYKLTSDYLDIDSLVTKVWTGQSREAPCLFKRNGVYFIMSSACTGWSPNQGAYGYAFDIAGPWSSLNNIGSSTTYNTQPHYVLKIEGSEQTSYLYMGDRWAGAWGDYTDNSLYVWLPLEFPTDTSMEMDNFDAVSIDTETGDIFGTSIPNGGLTKVDDDHASITYSSGWGTYYGNPGYNGTEHYSEVTDSEATFSFTGTKAQYYGFKRDDLGYADIYVDTVYQTSIDCYNNSGQYDVLLYETNELSDSNHTLAIVVSGVQNPSSSGTEIIVDAFAYYSPNDVNYISDLDPGQDYRIVNRNSSKVLTISGSDVNDSGALIQQHTYAAAGWQDWYFSTDQNSLAEITSTHSGQLMDVDSHSTSSGASIEQQPDSGHLSQKWLLQDLGTGYCKIANANSGYPMDLDDSSLEDAAQAVQYSNSGQGSQQWMLLPVPVNGIDEVFIEAETASQGTFSPFSVESGGAVPQGQYIIVPNGNGNQNGTPISGICTYDFNLDVNSTVEVWLLVNAPSGNDNSFQIRMDSDSYQPLILREEDRWMWVKWEEKELQDGSHSVSVAWLEDGTSLDKICLRITPAATYYPADFDLSGMVDLDDLHTMSIQWLQPGGTPSADIAPLPNGDGIVNLLDFAILAEDYLKPSP